MFVVAFMVVLFLLCLLCCTDSSGTVLLHCILYKLSISILESTMSAVISSKLNYIHFKVTTADIPRLTAISGELSEFCYISKAVM